MYENQEFEQKYYSRTAKRFYKSGHSWLIMIDLFMTIIIIMIRWHLF